MSVLVNKSTRVICKGVTSHSEQAIAYGTQRVGGATGDMRSSTVVPQ